MISLIINFRLLEIYNTSRYASRKRYIVIYNHSDRAYMQ